MNNENSYTSIFSELSLRDYIPPETRDSKTLEILLLTEGGALSIDDLLERLDMLSNQMDDTSQDIETTSLAFKIFNAWYQGSLPIENWSQVVRYNVAVFKARYLGHNLESLNVNDVIKINPELELTSSEYLEMYNEMIGNCFKRSAINGDASSKL